MNSEARVFLRVVTLAGLAIALIGCSAIREAAGVSKEPPDEFAVVTKAPLIMPPDYNLKPPKPGAAPLNQVSPTESAQDAITGTTPEEIEAQLPSGYSQEEKILLANTGAAQADHAIRQQILADAKSMEQTNDELTTKLLFQTKDMDAGNPLDADTEKAHLDAQKSAQGTNTPASEQSADTSKDKSDDTATINKDGTDNSDNGGWFGWIGSIF